MSKSYQATGIILQGKPMGETDRLLTVLSPEYGLIRAIAPGSRKFKSRLRGRSELFVVNRFLVVQGRSLAKITQAETLRCYPGLSQSLGKLTASQYLGELTLAFALSDQPQTEIYEILLEHLSRLEKLTQESEIYAHLAQAVFHCLVVGGLAPQVSSCCLTQKTIQANFDNPRWRVGFSFEAGGIVSLEKSSEDSPLLLPPINSKLGAVELTFMQHLGSPTLPQPAQMLPPHRLSSSLTMAWVRVENILRNYAQYHLGKTFRAASLIDSLISLEF
ncbi:MAG: DNA repair protein RecO [Microcystaceae cyanobacterium]